MTDFNNMKEIALMRKIVRKLPKNAIVVEIGSFKGRSTNVIADELKYANGGLIHAIDLWKGNTGWRDDFDTDVMKTFLNNVKYNSHVIIPVRSDSKKAYKQFKDNSVDMVFIDGDHSYEGVKADIQNFAPKIKTSGFLLLHDALEKSVIQAIQESELKYEADLFDISESLVVFKKMMNSRFANVILSMKWSLLIFKKFLWKVMQ